MTSPGQVPTNASSAVRALVQFAERSPATQADIDQVMRALVSHDDWYVPVQYAERVWGQSEFDQRLFDQPLRYPAVESTPVLNVFTDRDAAMLAEGRVIGVYGGPVPGTRLLGGLDGDLTALMVNPASPVEHQWYIASGGFEITADWASGIAVERALAERGGGPAPSAPLLAHRYQLLIEKASQTLAQIYLPDIDGAVSVCFTATDRVDEFLASLPPAARPLAELTTIDGQRLFEMMRGFGAAGVVVNAGSDDQTALTRDDVNDIINAAAARR